jgi:hypothetical protein
VSAPLNLTSEQMRKVAAALDAMSEMTKETGVDLMPYGNGQLGIDGNVLALGWDQDTQSYLINDRNGD